MARITVEDCIDKFPSRFELVLVASQRARKLHSGEQPSLDRENDKNTVLALREIAEETITSNEMKENLIEEYQTVTISDEEDENLSNESLENEEKKEEESEELVSDSSKQIEEEIKELTSIEDNDLKEELEIKEDLQDSLETPLSESDEQESIS